MQCKVLERLKVEDLHRAAILVLPFQDSRGTIWAEQIVMHKHPAARWILLKDAEGIGGGSCTGEEVGCGEIRLAALRLAGGCLQCKVLERLKVEDLHRAAILVLPFQVFANTRDSLPGISRSSKNRQTPINLGPNLRQSFLAWLHTDQTVGSSVTNASFQQSRLT